MGIKKCDNISNLDIINVLKSFKNFRGVFPIDLLPSKIKNNECGVINLDVSTGSGLHWVCYYNDPKLDFVEYFDPFGEYKLVKRKHKIIPTEIVKYLKSGVKNKIMYNDAFLQQIDSSKCGCFVIKYITLRQQGYSPKDTLNKFTEYPRNYNEKFVLKF